MTSEILKQGFLHKWPIMKFENKTRYCPECNRDIENWEEVDDGWICKDCNKFVHKDDYCRKCEINLVKDSELCAECLQAKAEMEMY